MGVEQFAIPFSISLLFLCVLERSMHAILCLLFRNSQIKQLAAQQVVVRQVELLGQVITVFTSALLQAVLFILSWWLLLGTFFTMFAVLHVSYEEYPSLWTSLASFYNANFGPWVSDVVLAPLQFLDAMLKALLPLYNAAVWWSKSLLFKGVLPIALREASTIFKMATTLLNLCKHLGEASLVWTQSFECVGEACLVPDSRVMDVLSSLGDLREFVALGLELGNQFCSFLTLPLDLLLYFMLDLNFSLAVHSLVNALLNLFVVMPHVTYERCALAPNNTFHMLLCTPDVEPFFNLLGASLSYFGLLVDNWLNVALVIVQSAVTGSAPSCDSVNSGLFPEKFMSDPVFGSNFTAVVGLTNWLYAVTDGYAAVYQGSDDASVRVQLWPYAMDASLGVAAVSYASTSNVDSATIMEGTTSSAVQTVDMLACNCSDVEAGIEILCAILPASGTPTRMSRPNYLLQVMFPDESIPSLIGKCANVDISVHSIRFSATRYETRVVGLGTDKASLPVGDCQTRGTCREVDAALYLIPHCSDGFGCTGECFPFCMALRESGTGNNNLQLLGASRWRSGYTMIRRDCTISTATAEQVTFAAGVSSVLSMVNEVQSALDTGAAAGMFVSGAAPECRPAQRITAIQSKNQTVPIRAAVRLKQQPLFVTGDVVFTERALGQGASSVVVERLTSTDRNVISLDTLSQDMPAQPPLSVQAQEVVYDDPSKVLIPPPAYYHRTVAVSTRNYVLYASPPALQCMQAYLDYCELKRQNSNELPRLGFLIKTSYGPIRIYRVSAYRKCKAYSCGSDLVKFTQLRGFDTSYVSSACDSLFNVSIVRLEYLNEDNVAVVVLRSALGEYDVSTGRAQGPNSGYTTYWLHPQTMELSSTIWRTSLPSFGYATLCPAMQRLPRLGSMLSEAAGAALSLARYAISVAIYTPGLVQIWKAGGLCPDPNAALRHSVLASCGDGIFSLEDFFDHVDDAALLFWNTLSKLAVLSGASSTPKANPIADVLNGMAQYGQGSMDAWAMGSSVMSLARPPIVEEAKETVEMVAEEGETVATLAQAEPPKGSLLQSIGGAFQVNAGVVAWSRLYYRVFSDIFLVILKSSLKGSRMTSSEIWTNVWSTLYDLRDYYTRTITDRTRMACAGIKLMLGYSNPWANLAYGYCAAQAELTNDILTAALNLFVNIPMIKCVCKDAAGTDFRAHVQDTCAPMLPLTVRPYLFSIVNSVQGNVANQKVVKQFTCSRLTEDLGYRFGASFDATVSMIKDYGLDALSGIVDYVLIPFDKDAGKCRDFNNDPHLVVLVPQPTDYFMRCADTSLCHTLCSAEYSAFYAANRTSLPSTTSELTVESLFFPGLYDPAASLSNVTALVEVPSDNLCTARQGPSDYAIAVAELSGSVLEVVFYCVPQEHLEQVPIESVYRAVSGSYSTSAVDGSVMYSAFVDQQGLALVVVLRQGDADSIFILEAGGAWYALPPCVGLVPAQKEFVGFMSVWAVGGSIEACVLVRGYAETFAVAEALTLRYDLASATPGWEPSRVDLCQFSGSHSLTQLDELSLLMSPRTPAIPFYSVKLGSTPTGLQVLRVVPLTSLYQAGISFPLADMVVAGRSLRAYAFYAVSRTGWDWLREVRVDGVSPGVFPSVQVTSHVTVDGHCDTVSCEGCKDLATNRLCQAYAKCALVNCIGTPVQLKKPLCGVGGVLRSHVAMQVAGFQGAWKTLSEMITLVVRLSTTTVAGVDVEFPDDAFFSYMCTAKDSTAHIFAIVTSMLNSFLQLGHANVGYMYHSASNVDTNADAVLTVTMTSVTQFLHQLFLLPLYVAAAVHHNLMCQLNGALAILSESGFTVRIRSAALADATQVLSGQCLTISEDIRIRYSPGSAGIGVGIVATIQNVFNLYILEQIQPFMSLFDSLITWFIGILYGITSILQSQYAAQCNPPDHYLQDVVQCACGDSPLAIPSWQSAGTYREHALWCSGTLGMVDGSNQPFVVFNPYSYAYLQSMSGAMQEYVQCASKSYLCTPPQLPEFDNQGVTLLNVLTKCRENFNKKQWDPFAYVLFDPTQRYRFRTTVPLDLPDDSLYGVGNCLVAQANTGSPNAPCLDDFLRMSRLNEQRLSEYYFAYERLLEGSGPQYVDACLTFTGPAQNSSQFANCLDDGDEASGCAAYGHAWTPSSSNALPVGSTHAVLYHGRQHDSLIFKLYGMAYDQLQGPLEASLTKWEGIISDVDAQIFSAEGDVVHQIMDCIFMGPFSRVDYWPMPRCAAGEECPQGPFWSRDSAGGASRNVDPYDCGTSTSPPFTCGSPARRSLVRYFVRKILNSVSRSKNLNMSLFQYAVRQQLYDIQRTWNDTSQSSYGCLCLNSSDLTRSIACCSQARTADDLLPDALKADFRDLSSLHILSAMEDQFDEIYTRAIQDRSAWAEYITDKELATYQKWTSMERPAKEAWFDPRKPVYNYTSSEANVPLQAVDSTLWDVCHASLKQVFWSMPLDPDTGTLLFGATKASSGGIKSDYLSFDALPYDGDPAALEQYVGALLKAASDHSPTYRHVFMRHHPSRSLMCKNYKASLSPTERTVAFSDYVFTTATGQKLTLQRSTVDPLPALDYRKNAIGATRCPCGWDFNGSHCALPAAYCSSQRPAWCSAPPDRAQEALGWTPPPRCPEFELSAEWGFTERSATEAWITGSGAISTSMEDLLRHGRAGLRAGGASVTQSSAPASINPSSRTVPIQNAQVPTCDWGEAFAGPSKPDLARGFVDSLFPMARGEEESGAVAYCFRFVVELARLQALRMVSQGSAELARQEEQARVWRRRCGAQLRLLHLCVSLDVFKPPVAGIKTSSQDSCGHFAPLSFPTYYTTPQCLLVIQGSFYDPCRCMRCSGDPSLVLNITWIRQTAACAIRFDPTKILNMAPIGTWGDAAVDSSGDFSELLDYPAFLEQVLDGRDALGNTPPGQGWKNAEGPADQSASDCSMIQDYWPDDWDYPVGYHPTVPCDASDAAYRSFDQAFGLWIDPSTNAPFMRYENDAFRNVSLASTHYGVNGLCRSGKFGLPLYNVNPMRYCTSSPTPDYEDFAVFDTPTDAGDYADWVCTTSSSALPWPSARLVPAGQRSMLESSLYSVGTAPNMPAQGSAYYPSDLGSSSNYMPGPWDSMPAGQGWGSRCSDFQLQTCSTPSDCPPSYTCRGRFCQGSSIHCESSDYCLGLGLGSCEGVCLESTVDCVKHSECPAGKMCTGAGVCVAPTIVVQNKVVDQTYALDAFGRGTCPASSANFSLLGASRWGHLTSDFLRVHGLCSYGDWYKYQMTLKMCPLQDRGTYFDVDPSRCPYVNLDSTVPNLTMWWPSGSPRPEILYMHPSNCDRDYERLAGFVGCAPTASSFRLRQSGQDITPSSAYDKYYKAHKGVSPLAGGVQVPLAKMPYYNSSKYGFLGIPGVVQDSDVKSIFSPCSALDQCSASPFTANLISTKRRRKTDTGLLNYTENDVFMCGSMGYWDGTKCRLDRTVAQVYDFLCNSADAAIKNCYGILTDDLETLCGSVQGTYDRGYASVRSNVAALNKILESFATPTDMGTYLATVDCASDLYAFLKASTYRNVYYFLDLAVKEVPFDWFFQCMLLNDQTINPDDSLAQDCLSWTYRAQYQPSSYQPTSSQGDRGIFFLRNVRGGYLRANVTAAGLAAKSAMNASANVAIQKILDLYYGGKDLTYPTCALDLKWDLAGMNIEYRRLLDIFYSRDQCSDGWLEERINYLSSSGYGISPSSWMEGLISGNTDNTVVQPSWDIPSVRPSPPTLLNLVRLFVQDAAGVVLAERVLGSSSTAAVTGYMTRNHGFVVTYSPPSQLSLTPEELSSLSLDPLWITGDDGDILTSDESDQLSQKYPFSCLYQTLSTDPATQYLDPTQCSSFVRLRNGNKTADVLRRCSVPGQDPVTCTNVPAFYAVRGLFECGYRPSNPVTECTSKSSVGCGEALLSTLYSQVLAYLERPGNDFLSAGAFPWTDQAPAFSFKLSSELDYLASIQPDKEKAVMCTINTDSLVSILQCTNPNYLALKSHIQSQMTLQGSVQVPASSELRWSVDRGFLSAGSIFGISNTNRTGTVNYLGSILDDAKACRGHEPADSRVCWKRSTQSTWNAMTPWTLGNWNPFVMCDVDYTNNARGGTEFVDAYCTPQTCPSTSTFYSNMPFSSACTSLYQTQVTTPNVPRYDEYGPLGYNLCHYVPEEDQAGCMHDQSLLGGFDGLPVGADMATSETMLKGTPYSNLGYSVAQNMYQASSWELPAAFTSGSFFAAQNPLWTGAGGPYGFLRVDEGDIGVHSIGLRVTSAGAYGTLDVYKVPLHTQDATKELDASDASSAPVSEWVSNMQANAQAESSRFASKNPFTVMNSPDPACPLRRFAFYGAGSPLFAPTLPSPRRAAHIFRNVTGGLFSHPTVQAQTDGAHLGAYLTPNGYCFCPVVDSTLQLQCQVGVTVDGHPCSLKGTVQAVAAPGTVRTSYAFTPSNFRNQPRPCTMQLDWPLVGGTMRDGSTLAGDFARSSDPSFSKCHVLGRLKPFRFMYKAVPTFIPDGDWRQGACRTRRVGTTPASLLASSAPRCATSRITNDASFAYCEGTPDELRIPRRTRLSPRAMYANYKQTRRSPCSACSPPPSFLSQSGRPIDPESSFGTPFRVSAARGLAKDLRDAVCGVDQACPVLNRTSWAPEVFLDNYLRTPWVLFNGVTKPATTAASSFTSQDVDDSARWTAKGWVYCPDRSSLSTGAGCIGSMSKQEWRTSKTRVCPRMVKALSANLSQDPLSTTPFCNIDNTTQAVCQSVYEARRLVTQANCIAEGNFSCLPMPWTYVPALFDPTNKQWTQRTVLDYYRSVNSSVCPYSQSESDLVAFNVQYMKNCPANSMNFFISVMEIVRVILRTVVLIITTVASTVVQLFGILLASAKDGFAGSVEQMKTKIIENYQWLKAQTSSMRSYIVDMLLDMIYSSGVLGEELKNFLSKVCNMINAGYRWFLDKWCNVISRALSTFFVKFRKGMSMIASGFEILQDFMDEILQGVLPASFMAKYGNDLFQRKLIEKYSEPTSRRKKALSRVQVNTKVSDKAMRINSKTSKLAAIGKGLGIAGTILSVGLGAWELAQTIQGMQLYPDNFTLFDFSDVFASIEDIVDKLNTQDTCMTFQINQQYNASNQILFCFSGNILSNPNLAQRASVTLLPTVCWANANPSLGQSNVFSCQPGSTCCSDNSCTSKITCNQCPTPAFEGTMRYSCNTLSRVCQCAVPLEQYTPCTRNGQCGLGSQCELASSASGVSYGTLPCSQCPNSNVYCMVQPEGFPGRCSCFTEFTVQQSLCADVIGTTTVFDANKICGYSELAVPSLTSWQFYMDEIAMMSCAQARQAVCSLVWTSGSSSLRMTVAQLPIRIGGSGRRRLLSDDPRPAQHAYDPHYEALSPEEDLELRWAASWDHAHDPCKSLITEFRLKGSEDSMGVLDREALKECVYWRFVGRRVIDLANMTSMREHDTFLLSPEDFAVALGSPARLFELLSKPYALLHALLYHPYLKPLRSAATVLSNLVEQNDMLVQYIRNLSVAREQDEERMEMLQFFEDLELNATLQDDSQPRRRLLGVDLRHTRHLMGVLEDVKLVQGFTALIERGDSNPPLDQRIASSWGEGPFAWPPRYDFSGSACPIGLSIYHVSKDTLMTLVLYYSHWDAPRPAIDRSFRNALPHGSWLSSVNASNANTTRTRSHPKTWASYAFDQLVSWSGTSPAQLVRFLTSQAPYSLEWFFASLTQCDFAAVLTCSRHSRDLLMSAVVSLLIYFILLVVGNSLRIPIIATLYFYSIPLFLLWYTYGVGPSCLPLLPTCLLDDVIAAVQSILPPAILFTPGILCDPSQSNSTSIPPDQSCFVSCQALNFTTWFDPVAYALCDIDEGWCQALATWSPSNSSLYNTNIQPFVAPFQSSISDKLRLHQNNSTMVAGRICTWATWVVTLPALIFVGSLGVFMGSVVLGLVRVGPAMLGLLAQTLAFHRVQGR